MESDGNKARNGAENCLTRKTKNTMSATCAKYDDLSKVDKAAAILGKVDAVKGTMRDNIAGMLKNTEQAEDLAEKSDQLNEQASVFKKKSTDLKKQMAWKNLKMTIILGTVIVVIILAITVPLVMKAKKLAGK